MSTPVNRGLPTQPAGKPLLESGHEPTNQPDPLSRQGCHGLPPRYTPAGQVWRGAEDRMHAIERPAHGRQVIYQAILTGGWRVFLPWASPRELEALIASGPADPNDPLYMPMQLARWIDSNRTKGADSHLGPDWRDHFVSVWLVGRASALRPPCHHRTPRPWPRPTPSVPEAPRLAPTIRRCARPSRRRRIAARCSWPAGVDPRGLARAAACPRPGRGPGDRRRPDRHIALSRYCGDLAMPSRDPAQLARQKSRLLCRLPGHAMDTVEGCVRFVVGY